jgi:ABC-type uncharacterized transport system auxiliary subunit
MLFIGCSRGKLIPTNYYILDYFSHLDDSDLARENPFPYTVWIPETKIPQNYSRRQIVVRHFGPKITYDQYNLWGTRLSSIIPELMVKKIQNYQFFKQARTELMREKADFLIESRISNIEFAQSENMNQARLVMEFTLRKTDQESIILRHIVNREDKISDDTFDNFVLRINTILLEEMDSFLKKTQNYLANGDAERQIEDEEIVSQEFVIVPEEKTEEGIGTLYVPNLSDTDNEPYFHVYNENNDKIESERMGNSIALPSGTYRIKYGSGSPQQLMEQKGIEIHPRYRTTIEPNWGCLMVDIQDEERNFAKIRYQIFDAETGESFGEEFPKNEEFGEKQTVWVLPPGLYKITINNEPFNTIRNYTTAFIKEGEMHNLRIVVALDDENNPTDLIGAGILSGKELLSEFNYWKVYSAIHGNMSVTSKNETDKDEQDTSITLTSQMETQLVYDKEPFHFVSKNIIDLGTNKTSDTDFRLSSDNFDLKNTLIYYFLKNIGFYGRANVKTHFFPLYSYFPEPSDYTLIDEDGTVLSEHEKQKKVQVRPRFYPLNMKQGIGLNLRLVNSSRISTSLRFGFGMEQNILRDVFAKESGEGNIYRRQKSDFKEGTEISLIGSVQLLSNISYSTDFYVLFPFDTSKNRTIEWENSINFKLFRFVSLDYKLRLENRFINEEEYLYREHSLFLRLTYFLN